MPPRVLLFIGLVLALITLTVEALRSKKK